MCEYHGNGWLTFQITPSVSILPEYNILYNDMSPKLLRRLVKSIFKTIGFNIYRLTGNEEQNAYEVQGLLTHHKPRIIFDVGAYIGVVSSRYHEMFPDATIHAFEPFPESYGKLKSNVGDSSNIILHNTAISNTEGKLILNINPFTASNSIFPTDPIGIRFWGQEILGTIGQTQVESTTIDAFCKKNAISQIDILKMDIQGAELQALFGAQELLSRKAILVIYFELTVSPTYHGQNKIYECLEFLDSNDYLLLDIYNPVRRAKHLMQIDVIFTNRSVYMEM